MDLNVQKLGNKVRKIGTKTGLGKNQAGSVVERLFARPLLFVRIALFLHQYSPSLFRSTGPTEDDNDDDVYGRGDTIKEYL